MKRWPVFSFLGWMVLPTMALAASYAPVADFSRVGSNPQCRLTTMHESFLNNWTPGANFFQVPAYPNAILTSAMASGKAQVHGRSYQTLPSAVLLSSDPPEAVVEFYQGKLGSGWHRAEDLDMVYLYRAPQPFASGEALTKQLMTMPGSLPHIAIDGEVAPCDQLLVPGARTRITIVSPPR
ncbi:MAG: hypothetical protein KC563_12485 [Nitrospira sp.]|nr:hypothetical protein [Nitrospira sp.]MCB9710934.1 hypothetical protein [Nitrospiraceae bacterium]MDR4488891.1 hypothetical protein [Nitrospirales bacterium]MCA9465349.1 hypothetical protein [Nitrospira sp.]MCA9476604.1 hypothetical protein [Nitrospira sp.]